MVVVVVVDVVIWSRTAVAVAFRLPFLCIVARPPNSKAVRLTHRGQLIYRKKSVNSLPPDVRF